MWFIFAGIVSVFALMVNLLIFFFGGGGRLPLFLLLPELVHLCSSKQGITMGTCKRSHSAIFRHIHLYSGIIKPILTFGITNHIHELVSYIQMYSEPCVTVYLMKWIPWFFLIPPWKQELNRTYIKRLEDVQFTPCVQGTGLNWTLWVAREPWILICLEISIKINRRIILWNTFLAPGQIK